jgi:hypothetical protein
MTLEEIVRRLAKHRQRATYGAVGGVLYGPNQGAGQQCGNLLARKPRDPHHSWVVKKTDGLPSGYMRNQMDPDVAARRSYVLVDSEDLESWLETHN